MKRKVFLPLLPTLLLLTLSTASVYATPLGDAFVRRGFQKISMFPDGAEWTFSTSDTTYVMHGWVTGPGPGFPEHLHWSEMSGEQKNEFLRTASFELSINDEPVELRRYQYYDHATDGMSVLYYVVFPAHSFELGTYTFVGTWNLDFNSIPHHFETTVQVTFV